MSESRTGFVLRLGLFWHGRRSGTTVTTATEARVWASRLDALEQADGLEAMGLPGWRVEPAESRSTQ